ncbi:hypothetical protein BG011_007850 [Mortierella polycephala]|uniref:Voltage-gated hydrogen channel 1 n=1 Tax=Mortierella polycephala TaxID=41804 RepID=A0A9P6QCX9_9FUNG|nr:hypothetical protein BG011_007850 [Mortierella polycephala]
MQSTERLEEREAWCGPVETSLPQLTKEPSPDSQYNPHIRRSKTCPAADHTILSHGSLGEANDGYNNDQIPVDPGNPGNVGETLTNRHESRLTRIRHRLGEVLETKRAHVVVLLFTLIDIVLVMLQIGASLLHLDETEEETWFIALFGHLSLAIVSAFMVEVLLRLFAFGPRYFWRPTPHGFLHLIDAVIILTSFLLEVFLKGAGQELSSLLIIFRLWRVLKLTGTVALEVTEHDHIKIAALEAKVRSQERELEEYRLKVQRLESFNRPLA